MKFCLSELEVDMLKVLLLNFLLFPGWYGPAWLCEEGDALRLLC